MQAIVAQLWRACVSSGAMTVNVEVQCATVRIVDYRRGRVRDKRLEDETFVPETLRTRLALASSHRSGPNPLAIVARKKWSDARG